VLTEKNQIGKREWLADLITRVDAKSKPLLAMIPKGEDIKNMLMEYQLDDFEDPDDISAADGADMENFDNATRNRQLVQTYCMKIMDGAMVSDLAENVSNVAGLSKGEKAEAIMKKLEKVGRVMEGFIAGDQEHQAGGGGVPYKIRGLGKWIQNGAQATLPVHEDYRTPSASINSEDMANIDTTDVNDLLESSYTKTGQEQQYELVCGPKLKRRFSSFVETVTGGASARVHTYDTKFSGTINSVVKQFEGDYGDIRLHTSLWNAHANFGGSAAANLRRGYGLIMKLLSLHYKRKPRVKELEDRGGGPRFLVDAIFGLRVKSPLPLFKFDGTA
jgi:hypothetical protein